MIFFVDMDGTLADFTLGYKQTTGIELTQLDTIVDWRHATASWWESLPPLRVELLRYADYIVTDCYDERAFSGKLAWLKRFGWDKGIIHCGASRALFASSDRCLVDDNPLHLTNWTGPKICVKHCYNAAWRKVNTCLCV